MDKEELQYITKAPWHDWEQFQRATDSTIEEWRLEVREITNHNNRVQKHIQQRFKELMVIAREIWPLGSKELKYLGKAGKGSNRPNRMEFRFSEAMHSREMYQKNKEKEEKQRKQKQDQLDHLKEETRACLKIAIKYGLDEELCAESLLDLLLEKNKYLALGWYMYKTRCNWSDGFYRARSGLRDFEKTEFSEQDELIAADIRDCFDSDDGRVFRDTEWNYNRLFKEFVDDDLYQDVVSLDKFIDEY